MNRDNPANAISGPPRTDGIDVRVQAVLDKYDVSQAWFARRIGIEPATFSRFMTGKTKKMDPERMKQLFDTLASYEAGNVLGFDTGKPKIPENPRQSHTLDSDAGEAESAPLPLRQTPESRIEEVDESVDKSLEAIRDKIIRRIGEGKTDFTRDIRKMPRKQLLRYYAEVLPIIED